MAGLGEVGASNETMIDIGAILKRNQREKEIRCPACDHLISDDLEAMYQHISYQGSRYDGPRKDQCPSCEAEVWVYEIVNRTYHVATNEQASEEWWK